ncbi:hypothetical protein DFJ74DRAFT_664289 [Hyaloraphidium curvatum]|nr:hypothetical protein DFJ74DRAFT_664289 [Hyaloraphidium curvatum]
MALRRHLLLALLVAAALALAGGPDARGGCALSRAFPSALPARAEAPPAPAPAAEAWEEEDDEDAPAKEAPKPRESPRAAPRRTQTWGEYLSAVPWSRFRLDGLFLLLIVAYYAVSYLGARRNDEIAKRWYKATAAAWEAQFAQLGNGEGHKLMRDGPSNTMFYATGRDAVRRMYGFFKLLPRNDPLLYIYRTMWLRQNDLLVLDFELDPDAADGFVWALLHKRVSDSYVRSKAIDGKLLRADLALPRPRSHNNLPREQLIQLTEAPEFSDAALSDPNFLALLRAVVEPAGAAAAPGGVWLEELSYSDVPREAVETTDAFERDSVKRLTLTLRLPPGLVSRDATDAEAAALRSLASLALAAVDLLAASRGALPADTRAKIKKSRDEERKKFGKADEEKRLEELRKRKVEARKAEERRIAALPADRRAREEAKLAEKDREKAMKRKGGKQKIVMA